MNITKTVLGVLFASALFTVAALGADATSTAPVVPTGHDLGQWTLSLGGSGTQVTSGDKTFAGGLNISVGHTGDLILPLEFGVRQGVGYSSGDLWSLNTHVYNDWVLVKLGSLELDLGGNGGAYYGNHPIAWTIAPEAVERLWLTKTVNAYLREEYAFNVSATGVEAKNALGIEAGLQVRF